MRKKNQPQLMAVAGRNVKNQPQGYLFLLPAYLCVDPVKVAAFAFSPFLTVRNCC